MIYMIIPAYNEQDRIGKKLDDLKETLIKKYDIRIIVVSDSTDNTNRIVSSYASKYKQIRLIIVGNSKVGKGNAIIEGLKIAYTERADIIGFSDADLSVSGNELIKLLESLKDKNIDCVIGSRYVNGSQIIGRPKLSRFVASRCYNILVNLLFDFKYKDTQCGAKFFKRNVLGRILDNLYVRDMSFDINLLYEMKKHDFNVIEIPVNYKTLYTGTKLRLSSLIPQMFISTINLRIRG